MSLQQCHAHGVTSLILNRPKQHNAFDAHLIETLTTAIQQATQDDATRVILLKAKGQHFSAGADLKWMQQIAHTSFEDNLRDAEKLATLLHTLYHCPKPTIAEVQGAAYGGGLGLIAACDIAIAATNAQFCFSEVSLGLIPATIAPFIIESIGSKAAKWLFLSAEKFNTEQARALNLIQHSVPLEQLTDYTVTYATKLAQQPPKALQACKRLVHHLHHHPINASLLADTAKLLAEQRVSQEALALMLAFLKKHQ